MAPAAGAPGTHGHIAASEHEAASSETFTHPISVHSPSQVKGMLAQLLSLSAKHRGPTGNKLMAGGEGGTNPDSSGAAAKNGGGGSGSSVSAMLAAAVKEARAEASAAMSSAATPAMGSGGSMQTVMLDRLPFAVLEPDHAGFLSKRSKKAWDRKWFKLRRPLLMMYRSKDDALPQEVITLRDCKATVRRADLELCIEPLNGPHTNTSPPRTRGGDGGRSAERGAGGSGGGGGGGSDGGGGGDDERGGSGGGTFLGLVAQASNDADLTEWIRHLDPWCVGDGGGGGGGGGGGSRRGVASSSGSGGTKDSSRSKRERHKHSHIASPTASSVGHRRQVTRSSSGEGGETKRGFVVRHSSKKNGLFDPKVHDPFSLTPKSSQGPDGGGGAFDVDGEGARNGEGGELPRKESFSWNSAEPGSWSSHNNPKLKAKPKSSRGVPRDTPPQPPSRHPTPRHFTF